MPTNTRWTELTETLVVTWASLAAQTLKNLPAMQETLVQSLGQEDPWRREWLPTQVFLPREFHRQRMVTWVNVILQRVGGLWHGCSGQSPGKSMTPDSWFPPPWILMWLLCNEAWESEFFFLNSRWFLCTIFKSLLWVENQTSAISLPHCKEQALQRKIKQILSSVS